MGREVGEQAEGRNPMTPRAPYGYLWRWNKWPTAPGSWAPGNRAGQSCRVVTRGRRMNSALVEFEDGARFVVSRNGLARKREEAAS